jgi:hypothetical protein
MKKLFLLILSLMFAFMIGSKYLTVEADSSVSFVVESYFDSSNHTDNTVSDISYGTIMSFDSSLASSDGYTFRYWVVNNVVEFNSSIGDSFPVCDNGVVKALFSPNASNLVVFMDSNGQYLEHSYVADGGTAAPTIFAYPSKPGYQLTAEKWDKPLTDITEDTVFILQYEKTFLDSFSLTVNNGTGTGSYPFNTEVTVVAEIDGGTGLTFSHWVDAFGQVLSYSPGYTFTVFNDMTITAVGAVTPPTDEPIVSTHDLMLRDGYHSYLSQIYVPVGTTIIEYGMLTSVAAQSPTLDMDHYEGKFRSAKINSASGEFLSSIPKDHFYARSYLVTKTGELLTTTYGPVLSYNSDKNPVVLDFSDETKDTYDSEMITIDGNDWGIQNALIGDSESDLKYGSKSLRVQANGGIVSATSFDSGVSTIHFLYGLYEGGTAANIAVQYAYSWAPGVWNDVESISLDDTNTQLRDITATVNIAASIRIRIGVLDGSNMVNIDNIIINEAEYTDPNSPVILGTANAGITEGDPYDPLDGVQAIDFYDGDITTLISVITKDSENAVVVVDPSDYSGLAYGTYSILYSVEDTDGNTDSETITLTISMAPALELFISEYVEGTAPNDVAIEIYNPSGVSIDLSGYTIRIAVNGGTFGDGSAIEIALSGTVASGDVFVIANSLANASILAVTDQTDATLSFDGNDAIGLFNTGAPIDFIGVPGSLVDPEWTVAGVENGGTMDNTLIRNSDVTGGTTTWNSTEWTSYAVDDYTHLGSHSYGVK